MVDDLTVVFWIYSRILSERDMRLEKGKEVRKISGTTDSVR